MERSYVALICTGITVGCAAAGIAAYLQRTRVLTRDLDEEFNDLKYDEAEDTADRTYTDISVGA